jgi:C-terminal peptidase prc
VPSRAAPALLLALAGCASVGPPARPVSPEGLLAGRLALVVDVLEKWSFPRVAPAAFAEAGLGAAARQDPALRLELVEGGVAVSHGGTPLGPCRGPLQHAVTCALAAAHGASPALRAESLEAVATIFLEAGARSVPGASYHRPAEWQAARRPDAGVAVGLVFRREAGGLVRVVEVLSGSPAEGAGLDRGDELASIDGESLAAFSLDEVVRRLRGAPGSRVRLGIRSPGGASREVTVDRAPVEGSLGRTLLLPGTVAYVPLATIGHRTADRVWTQLAGLRASAAGGRLGGVVLDLRGNRGGVLEAAIPLSALFVGPGPLYSLHGAKDRVEERARPPGPAPFAREPLVVLVDQETSAGAEVVAAALQDRGRATVVGSRTGGVGAATSLTDLGELGALLIPVARIHRAGGAAIDGEGVVPEVCTATWPPAVPSSVTLDLLRERLAAAPADCPRRASGRPRREDDLDLAAALVVLDSPLRQPVP